MPPPQWNALAVRVLISMPMLVLACKRPCAHRGSERGPARPSMHGRVCVGRYFCSGHATAKEERHGRGDEEKPLAPGPTAADTRLGPRPHLSASQLRARRSITQICIAKRPLPEGIGEARRGGTGAERGRQLASSGPNSGPHGCPVGAVPRLL
ncbi:uncharacterized protein B0I36DRAFT_347104 [Microdochium trichocladiopsis]|uniref:Secreted protein n=1 Tax=Microdochium trichocladiopsis TaxID=1682393 RepID=A0A9P8YC28_9PEZI|nr:uncharacterized protein B0I36DRAFT_347104 [Microdochium trichocladiopsis]KAH7035304.1 hypothetical protein B0I36DRAFT_347104 [Microdochium trichocladiopsis]